MKKGRLRAKSRAFSAVVRKGGFAPLRHAPAGAVTTLSLIHISGTIAGCYVLEGKVTRAAKIRLVRDGIVITEDEIDSLRRFKDDVKDVYKRQAGWWRLSRSFPG